MEFRILGPLEARLGDHVVAIKGGSQRALLARLLLDANRVVSVDRLLADLWAAPPGSEARALHQRVLQLRRSLGEGGVRRKVIITREPGYVIQLEPNELDLHRFEGLVARGEEALAAGLPDEAGKALREALDLWRGEPLAEFPTAPFSATARARLEELYLVAIEERFEADLALGRHVKLIGDLEVVSDKHPFREGFRAQLMLAQYRAGRQAEALETYQRTRRTLVDELGVEPTRGLQDLERAILAQDPALELSPVTADESGSAGWEPQVPERSILVVPNDDQKLERLLAIAEPLTRRPPREIIVTALAATAEELERSSARLEAERQALIARKVPARAASFTSASSGSDLVRLADAQDVDLLLTDAPAELLEEGLLPADMQAVLHEAPCDVATLVGDGPPREQAVSGVVVPFGGTTHDWAALEIGAWVAASRDAPLTLLGTEAQPGRKKRDASRLLADVSLLVQRATGVAAQPKLLPPGEDAILRASRDAYLLIVGLSDRWSEVGLGTARLALARSAELPTLLVRRGVRPGGIAPPDHFTRYTWSLSDGHDSGIRTGS